MAAPPRKSQPDYMAIPRDNPAVRASDRSPAAPAWQVPPAYRAWQARNPRLDMWVEPGGGETRHVGEIPPRSGSSNRSAVKGVSAWPSSFLSMLVRSYTGDSVVYAIDAKRLPQDEFRR